MEAWNLQEIVRVALMEDIREGDLTAKYFVPEKLTSTAHLVARAEGVLAGMEVAREVFRQVDEQVSFQSNFREGDTLKPGDILAEIKGSARSLLTAERTALNFLQRMSGIASLTRSYVNALAPGFPARILDTRKTIPGWRMLDKMAVRAGGGTNHRMGLYDMVMVKDNHLMTEGSSRKLQRAILALHQDHPHVRVEVEADTLKQVKSFLDIDGIAVILLDNMSLEDMRKAVAMRDEAMERGKFRVELEASGGINLQTIRAVSETGVDWISVGALTHSATALDLALDFK